MLGDILAGIIIGMVCLLTLGIIFMIMIERIQLKQIRKRLAKHVKKEGKDNHG